MDLWQSSFAARRSSFFRSVPAFLKLLEQRQLAHGVMDWGGMLMAGEWTSSSSMWIASPRQAWIILCEPYLNH